MTTSTKVMSVQLEVKNKTQTPNGESTFVISAPYGDTPVVTLQNLAVDLMGKIINHESADTEFADYNVEQVKVTGGQKYLFFDPTGLQTSPSAPLATAVNDFLLKVDGWTEATTTTITVPAALLTLAEAISTKLFPLFEKACKHVNTADTKVFMQSVSTSDYTVTVTA